MRKNDAMKRAQLRRKGFGELPTVLSVDELAAFMNLPRATVSRKCQDGTIFAVKIGKQWRIPREPLERLFAGGDAV